MRSPATSTAPSASATPTATRTGSALDGAGQECRREGAQTAYLQVREENEVARALYASLGFRDAYRYTHRVMR